MTRMMIHRGPVEDGFLTNDYVSLGMRRLSIIDIEGGHQPVWNEDRSVAVILNGEIYNYRELARELRSRGHRLETQSDTEVIAHLYEEDGTRCVDRLNGMFAFALWDEGRKRLLVARDRAGVKPLYFAQSGGRLAFASEMKALLLCDFIPRTLDIDAMADYLALMYIRAPRTPFSAIKKLRPGYLLTVEDGRVSEHQYWRLADHYHAAPPASFEAAAEQLRELVTDAVSLRLRSDVPVGAFLSGGLDSSAVVWAAAGKLDHPLDTFNVNFEGSGMDERPYARAVATRFGSRHHEQTVTAADALQHLPLLMWHLDEPNADSAIVPTYLVSRFAAASLRVVLTGVGGDELFGGYSRYFDGQLREHAWRRFAPLGKAVGLTAALRACLPELADRLADSERSEEDRYFARVAMFPESAIGDLLGLGPRKHLEAEFAAFPGQDPVNRRMFVDLLTYLPDDVLHLTDRMSMAVSLEARTPLLDYRLIEFAASLPGSWKADPLRRSWKRLMKRAFAGRLPAEILSRPKWGFGAPVLDWMRGGLHADAVGVVRRGQLVESGIARAEAVDRCLQDAPKSIAAAQRAWALLVWEVWHRVFVGRTAIDRPSTLMEMAAVST